MSKYKTDGSVIIDVEADLSKFQSSISKIATVGTVAFTALVGSVAMATKAIIDVGVGFESAFAGVKKTVNASEKELEGFRKEILNLSTDIPIVANEIAGIAEAAGQLGIKNENLMSFTRTMADLGVATNMASTEAATSFARFANITNMNQKEFDRLGSTVVELGNKLATTEREIADLVLNMASVGSQVGMTEAEIMGLAAALSSVGIEAAAGGTSMRTILSEMQLAVETGNKDLEKFANVANKSSEEFVKAFKEDATGAFLAFVEGLGDTERLGSSATKILDEMGISEARLTNLLKSGSNAVDLFKDSIAIANTAWEENTALTKEAAQRYETTESKMQILNNTIAKAGITAFEKFKEPFKDAIDTGIESVQQLTGELENGKLGKSVDNVANSFNNMLKKTIEVGTKALPPLIDGLSWILDNGNMIVTAIIAYNIATKGTMIIAKVANQVKIFNGLMKMQATVTGKAGASLLAFSAKTRIAQVATGALAGGITSLYAIAGGLAVAAIAALTVGLINYVKKLDNTNNMIAENSKKMKELRESMEEVSKQSEENFKSQSLEIANAELYAAKIKELVDENGNLTGSKEDLIGAVGRFNDAVGESFFYYDEETGKLMTQSGEVANLSTSIKDLIAMKYANAFVDTGIDEYTEACKKQSEIVELNRVALEKYNEAKDKYSEYDLVGMSEFNQKLIDGKVGYEELNTALANFGVTDIQFSKIMSEFDGPLRTMISNSEEFGKLQSNIIDPLEAVQAAIANSDYDKLNNFKLGLDISQEATSLDEYNTKIGDIQTKISEMDQFKDLGIKFNPDEYEALKVQLEELKLNKEKIFTTEKEVLETEVENAKTNFLDPMASRINEHLEAVDGDYTTHGNTSGTNFKTAVELEVSKIYFAPKYVDIIARYVGFDGVGGSASGAFPGASYDDNQGPYPIIQPNYSRSMIDSAKSVINQVQSRIRNASNVGNMTLQLQGGNGGGATDIQQHVNFNQPIRKTSDVTRALEKAARDLKKVR